MKNELLISGAVIFKREGKDKILWMLVKVSEDSDWEIAKVTVRKGESSVRAALRMTAEQAGMNTKVLEEAGRVSSVIQVNGKPTNRKEIYYVMLLKGGDQNLGFFDVDWFDYTKARRSLKTKKEQGMLSNAKKEADNWLKRIKVKKIAS